MIDVTSLVLLATSFFFVALSFGLLVKYREVSERINASTDLGRDLWSSLEQRLKKQDERILDMMGRFEVVQSRVLMASPAQVPSVPTSPATARPPAPQPDVVSSESHTEAPSAQQLESLESQPPPTSQGPEIVLELDKTERLALSLLVNGPLATPAILQGLVSGGGPRSREHAARLMKDLFEKGLVSRNDSAKPFVYQLTEEGRKRLASP